MATRLSETQFQEFLERFAAVARDSGVPLTIERVGVEGQHALGVWLAKEQDEHPIKSHFVSSGGEYHAYQLPVGQFQRLPQRDYVLMLHDPDASQRSEVAGVMVGWLEKHLDSPAASALRDDINAALQAQSTS